MVSAGKIIDIDAFKKKESGLATNRTTPIPDSGNWRKHAPSGAIILLLAAALTYLVSPPQKEKVPVFEVDSIAPVNIKATEDMLVEDRESTEKNRQIARDSTLDIYDLDSTLEAKDFERVRKAFSIVHKGYLAYSEQAYTDVLAERDRMETIGGIEEDSLSPERLEQSIKTISEFEKTLGYEAMMNEFKAAIGMDLEPKTLAILKYYHFWPRVEQSIYEAIHDPLVKGIVPSKNKLPPSSTKGMIIKDVASGEERVIRNFDSIMDLEETGRHIQESVAAYLPGDKANLRKAVVSIAMELCQPNLTYNSKETLQAQNLAAESVNPVFFQVQRGEMIVREGERVTDAHNAKLRWMAEKIKDTGRLGAIAGSALVCFLFVILGGAFIYLQHEEIRDSIKMQALISMLLAGHISLVVLSQYVSILILQKAPEFSMQYLLLAGPVVFGPLIISMLFTVELTVLFAILSSAITGIMLPNHPLVAVLTLTGGLICAFFVRQYKKRTTLLKVGLLVSVFNTMVVAAMELILGKASFPGLTMELEVAMLGGLTSAFLVSGAIPLVESLFPVVSDVKLLELTNLNHPLLRRMVMEAPGTYHHSMMVGNLAEEACKAIGANALLARAGSLFHDIGKLKKAEYFVENQREHLNPHDKLTPSMSTLVIISHIRDGLELARQHKLLPQIAAMIPEHHGTQLVRWFYHKAKMAEDASRDEIKEDNYKYPGPIPSSKESACVAMADSIEAAARALEEPTPQRLRDLVTEIINDKFVQGQLDNSHLTFHELALIVDSFIRTLTGIHHHRIKYPEKIKDQGAKSHEDTGSKKAQSGRP